MTITERLAFEERLLNEHLEVEKRNTEEMINREGLKRDPRDQVINKLVTHVVGLLICALLATLASGMILVIGILPYFWITSLVWLLFFVIATLLIYIPGLKEVPVIHHGLLTLFGGRVKWLPIYGDYPVLNEGWSWIPPFFMDMIKENMQEEVMDFPPTAEEKGIRVPALALEQDIKSGVTPEDPTSTARKAVLMVRVAIAFKRFNSYKSEDITPKELEDGLRNRVISTLRYIGTLISDIGFMRHQDLIAKIIEEVVDRDAKYHWGRDTKGVSMPKIVYEDEKLNRAFEQSNVEDYERNAERLELSHVREQIEFFRKQFKTEGISDEKALELAYRIVMAERSKSQHITIDGTATPLERAGALAGGLGKQSH